VIGDLQGGLVELADIDLREHIQPGLLVGAHVLQPFLIFFPTLVARPVVPVAHIARGNPFANFAESRDDLRIRDAVAKHKIDPVTIDFAHSPDFAPRTTGFLSG